MIKVIDISVPWKEIQNETFIREQLCAQIDIHPEDITHVEIRKRSLDARKKNIRYNLRCEVYVNEAFEEITSWFFPAPIQSDHTIHIIGCGPAGLFTALQALELGIKPIIFERGKDVRSRRRDLVQIHRDNVVNPDSNYCFGEGGAGTFSDGKLYTRSKKRGNVQRALEWFVHFGADKDILVNAHPHIGTNRLPKIIQAMREKIIACGGEVHFNSKLTDITIDNNQVKGFTINGTKHFPCSHLVLATGHSARDIFELLHRKEIKIEAKPFALGVRIEHPQKLIDQIQYHGLSSNDLLPPAAYSLVTQIDGMGVYSFCMCPGGIVAPCATSPQEVVTNGWSPSKRNNAFANSGMVVQIEPKHLLKNSETDPFICLNFQKKVEYDCWIASGKTQAVPAQRLTDFIDGKKSEKLPESSYQPGLVSVNLHEVLPGMISKRLKKAFVEWGKKMPGFITSEAILHAPESRTSSPVKIPRGEHDYNHVQISGLYPIGEGAGYAGGIMSSAVDGMNCASWIFENKFKSKS